MTSFKKSCVVEVLLALALLTVFLSNNLKQKKSIEFYKNEYLLYSSELSKYLHQYASIRLGELENYLSEIIINVGYDSSFVCLFIPKNICLACLDRDLECLLQIKSNVCYLVIAPTFLKRDLRARLSGSKDYSPIFYQDDFGNGCFEQLDQCVWFYYEKKQVRDVYISSKLEPSVTTEYLKKLFLRFSSTKI